MKKVTKKKAVKKVSKKKVANKSAKKTVKKKAVKKGKSVARSSTPKKVKSLDSATNPASNGPIPSSKTYEAEVVPEHDAETGEVL